MKKLFKKTKGLVRGTPVAVLVSIGIHALLIFAAGTWVVFKLVNKQETVFIPVEQIDKPVVKLKKLQVKVKQDSKPKSSTERISTDSPKVISDIALPEMGGGGAAEALGVDIIGGLGAIEDMSEMTLMGTGKSIGNDLTGTYYYMRMYRNGSGSDILESRTSGMERFLRTFFESGWDTSVFDPYWRAPRKLHATQLFIPWISAIVAPDNFGDDDLTRDPSYWLVHYKGKIGYPKEILEDFPDGARFRFYGYADNYMYVRVNGEVILDGSYVRNFRVNLANWTPTADTHNVFPNITANNEWRVSDWFEMTPNELTDIEILIGEEPGGNFCAILCIEQEGVEYPRRENHSGPLLPIFRMAPPPPHVIDEIHYRLAPGMVDLTGGPNFSIY
jgi:hypothetical protein